MREKIEGVKDCLKIVREDIKIAKKELESAENEYRAYGSYDDCGESFHQECIRKQQHLDSLVQMKIKLEKYSKKLGHDFNEKYSEDPYMDSFAVQSRWEKEFEKYGKLIIAYDFDYTVHNYQNESFTYKYISNLLREWRPYATFVIFSASPESRFDYIKKHLEAHDLPYDAINRDVIERDATKKIYYNVFLDDRAGLYETAKILENILEKIKSGKLKYNPPTDEEYFGELTNYEKSVVKRLREEGFTNKKIKESLKEL